MVLQAVKESGKCELIEGVSLEMRDLADLELFEVVVAIEKNTYRVTLTPKVKVSELDADKSVFEYANVLAYTDGLFFFQKNSTTEQSLTYDMVTFGEPNGVGFAAHIEVLRPKP